MKFSRLVQTFQDRPFFESDELDSLFDESSHQIRARLSRWVEQKKLVQLRRGKYVLPVQYRRQEPSFYYISNYLYRPSYVSLHSALEFHGLIPEAVAVTQAVTPKHGQECETPLGAFRYYSIKQNRFSGYREYSVAGTGVSSRQRKFLMATPEKAVLDLFYLYKGEWTQARIQEMRFQNVGQINAHQLREDANKLDSRKVRRAAERFLYLFFGSRRR